MTIVILICACVAAAAVAYALPTEIATVGRRLLAAQQRSGGIALRELYISGMTQRELLTISLIIPVVVALVAQLLFNNVLVSFVLGGASFFLPNLYLNYLREKRLQQFDERLPLAIDQMVAATRANLNLGSAIKEASENSPEPVAREFQSIVQDFELAADIDEALEKARKRLRSRSFDLLATALKVNRDKGGNLPRALETMSSSLKEIWRLEQKVITASSEGRKAVKWISATPVLLFFMISAAQPNIIDTLTGSPIGILLIVVAVSLYVFALWWLRRILRVDV